MDCDCAKPPDYSEIAAANDKASEYAYKAAQDDLAFRKSQYEESMPYIQTARDLGLRIADQQSEIMDFNYDQAKDQWGYYKDTFRPVEEKMVSDAMGYDSPERMEQLAGDRRAQVAQSFDAERDAAARRLISMGVNPNSGRFAGLDRAGGTQQAAVEAATMNQARTEVGDKAIALRTGASNFGRNMPNTATSAFSTAVGAGNSATGNANATANSTIPWTSTVGQGYGMQMNASNQQINANLGLAGLMSNDYGVQAQLDASSGGGFGSAIGGIAMGVGAAF